jgi:hypothetical protein
MFSGDEPDNSELVHELKLYREANPDLGWKKV